MKYLIVCLLVVMAGCSGSNQYGKCVGLSSDDQNPALRYKIEPWNAFWSVVGIETIIAPILWATDYAYCPVGPALKK